MNIRICLIVFLSVLGLLIISAIIGNILEFNGTLGEAMIGPKGINVVVLAIFALFCVMIFTFVPLIIRFFIFNVGQNRQWRTFPFKNCFRHTSRLSSTVSGS
jgi:hypothetical protein